MTKKKLIQLIVILDLCVCLNSHKKTIDIFDNDRSME